MCPVRGLEFDLYSDKLSFLNNLISEIESSFILPSIKVVSVYLTFFFIYILWDEYYRNTVCGLSLVTETRGGKQK